MFSPGTPIQFIHDSRKGKVIQQMNSETVLIEDEDGLEYEVKLKEIMPLQSQDLDSFNTLTPIQEKRFREQNQETGIYSKHMKKVFKPIGVKAEIDIHLEELLDEDEHTSDPLSLQIRVVKDALRYCQAKKIKELIVIHGKGTGILKTTICNFLKSETECEFMDASYNEYGFGALRIFIHGDI